MYFKEGINHILGVRLRSYTKKSLDSKKPFLRLTQGDRGTKWALLSNTCTLSSAVFDISYFLSLAGWIPEELSPLTYWYLGLYPHSFTVTKFLEPLSSPLGLCAYICARKYTELGLGMWSYIVNCSHAPWKCFRPTYLHCPGHSLKENGAGTAQGRWWGVYPPCFWRKDKISIKILCAVLLFCPGKRPWHVLFISRDVTDGNYCPWLLDINNVHHATETIAACEVAFAIIQEMAVCQQVNQVINDLNIRETVSFLKN